MDERTLENLLKINRKFYKENAKSFDSTRQYFWDGWLGFIKYLNINNKIDVVDLGCGNGRFASYLQRVDKRFNYLGIDSSEKLIKIAKDKYKKYQNITFLKEDILEYKFEISKYNIIVIFGLIHHIPGKANRFKFLSNIFKNISNNTLIFMSLWNFNWVLKLFKESKKIISKYDLNLEKGDYFLKWQDSEYPRYCHFFSDDEITEIEELIRKNNIEIIDKYYSDGKTKNSNLYLIIKKRCTISTS